MVLNSCGNLVLNVAKNPADSSYRFSLTNSSSASAVSGSEVRTTTAASTNTVEKVTEYDDSAIYYADGKGNNFHFNGLLLLKANAFYNAGTNEFKMISLVLNGTGGGKFFNPTDGTYDEGVFTRARWSAAGTNVFQ